MHTIKGMTPHCPNSSCTFFESKEFVRKNGHFYRRCESRNIARFICLKCKKSFSHATGTLEYRQKKRRENLLLRNLLASSISLRRSSLILGISRTTVDRKFVYLAKKARLSQDEFLKSIRGTVSEMQFDDLITTEHTKLKPVTVSVAVDKKRRFILGVEVGKIPAFGKLSHLSVKKYGTRRSEHQKTLEKLFKNISETLSKQVRIESDEHNLYPLVVKKYAPHAKHLRYKGGRGCVVGQGELKKLGYDPLFTLNHTCAMLRANINRLVRKTWCTNKKLEKLKMHLDIFVDFYNQVYL